jgi:hypothetical protein
MWNRLSTLRITRDDTGRSRRRARRPMLEALEGRVVLSSSLPDIDVLSARETDANHVVVTYQVLNAPVASPFPMAIDRSGANAVNAQSIQVAEGMASGGNLSLGTHTLTVTVSGGLTIDPAHPFVIAVAKPNPTVAETNDPAFYRITTIAAVTQGFGDPRLWVDKIASELKTDDGFDITIPFHWVADSVKPVSGLPATDGKVLANQIDADAKQLPSGTVIDLQLIAHSRGCVVIDQAMWDLVAMEKSGQHPELSGLVAGYTKMTLLDPHPATNTRADGSPAAFYSASTGPFGQMAVMTIKGMQNIMHDPDITIPAGVNDVEEFYQHTNVTAGSTLFDQLFSMWGEAPIPGVNHYYDVTALLGGVGHRQVPIWYMDNVVPTLAHASPTVNLPGLVATSAPDAPTPIDVPTGEAYEVSVIAKFTSSLTVAQNIENLMANVYSELSSGHTFLGAVDLVCFETYVTAAAFKGQLQASAALDLSTMVAMISDYILGNFLPINESL